MKRFGTLLGLILAAAVLSLGTSGCKSTGKSRHDDHPSAEHPKGEQPKGDHPKH